jgi:hypothetical protein
MSLAYPLLIQEDIAHLLEFLVRPILKVGEGF